ncbi:Ku protein [Streptomyces nigrescens]
MWSCSPRTTSPTCRCRLRLVPSRCSPSSLQTGSTRLGLGDPATARPYALLRDAMHESGLATVVRVALRNRESLALLRPRGVGHGAG